MKNTSGIPRKVRKSHRREYKATWKKELLNYYIVGETNTSNAGIIYQKLKVSTAVKPLFNRQEHPVGALTFKNVKKLLGL